MNQYARIKLTEILPLLDKPEEEDKPFLFVNPSGALATFFKYKGHMMYITELAQSLSNDISMKSSVKTELWNMFETGMKIGYWTVLNMESSTTCNLLEFLKLCDYKDKDMLLPSKIKDKDYCLAQNILRKENDKDFDGNYGYFQIKDTFKLVLLSTIKEDQIEELLKNNPELNAKVIVVYE